MTVRIPRETVEKLETVITADADPTGLTVAFAFTASNTDDRPSGWTAGTWDGTYANGKATAVTATIGGTSSGATHALATGTWKGWVRVTDNPEVPVRECGLVVIA